MLWEKRSVREFARKYKLDEKGSMALSWAISSLVVLIAVGSAYDLNRVSKAKMLSQMAADNMALAASVAVDTDNKDRYQENAAYTYKQIGGPSYDFTNSITGRVQYDLVDDQDPANAGLGDADKKRLIARATVSGEYTPAFLGILPTFQKIPFRAVTDVAYAQRKGTPASIFFAVDNSGSMGYRDNNSKVKIDGLETSLKDFMSTLNGLNNGANTIFRTALYPYHSSLRSSHIVSPAWGTFTDYEVTRMYASGGTNSTPALTLAANALPLENNIHKGVNKEEDPLKFLVFMTDGENNPTTERICTWQDEDIWVPGSGAYWVKIRGRNTGRTRTSRPRNTRNWRYESGTPGYWDTRTVEVCENKEAYYENDKSLVQCQKMKDEGVKIYSIAYDIGGNNETQQRVETFMKSCSSGDEYFKSARDASALEATFEQIGAEIVEEVIRLKR